MSTTVASDLTPEETRLVNLVWSEGSRLYRKLPWRSIEDPYGVLVSEVMLQQTQVARVDGRWQRFLTLFPTIDALAAADTSLVLEQWQGLGYNRRALALKRTAEVCSAEYGGVLPEAYEDLVALPGIGPATAGGVLAFAFQRPVVYLETNVRTVFLHELFPNESGVSDRALIPHVERTCSVDDPRGWYYALLDYGAHLKATVPNPSRASRHHTRQSRFEGSRRQKRAELVRIVLARRTACLDDLMCDLSAFERAGARPAPDASFVQALADELAGEGFFYRTTCPDGTVRYHADDPCHS